MFRSFLGVAFGKTLKKHILGEYFYLGSTYSLEEGSRHLFNIYSPCHTGEVGSEGVWLMVDLLRCQILGEDIFGGILPYSQQETRHVGGQFARWNVQHLAILVEFLLEEGMDFA